ncbi:type 1 glutamine amidotransferase domain-containing protein [Paenibacillus methanolicus]|uniref:Putative intracellular protease/amidase n=1 Tax=Paenibacillus methanolicus TaxID=582686 RepID=A0A5S5BVH9_9BACL|nr:type 1 glutamine amidotransferase domain-containing protein [Paenibacillus methanolicus]TYP70170.1 putative intracellular protease/amidase [Paenibacillus methanolicus]
MKHILIVVTSASRMNEEKETGLWLSEFAEPYLAFTQEGYAVTVASPLGGRTPIDPSSLGDVEPELLETRRFLERTVALDEVDAAGFDAIFLPGGHGTMFDLPDNERLQRLLRDFFESGRVVAAVCHGPAGLVRATRADGKPLVEGKRLTAFTDSEEKAAGLDAAMPFLLETELRQAGAIFVADADWADHVEVDGSLITGQNPQSTLQAAKAVIAKLKG